jgi:hypothetical protein
VPPKDSTQQHKFAKAPHAQLLTDECSLDGSANFRLGSFSMAGPVLVALHERGCVIQRHSLLHMSVGPTARRRRAVKRRSDYY